jgi:hypothetical protein
MLRYYSAEVIYTCIFASVVFQLFYSLFCNFLIISKLNNFNYGPHWKIEEHLDIYTIVRNISAP